MIEWQDTGTLLSVRPHGESSAIVEVFTANHGRHAGVVRGGTSRRISPILQPGADLSLVWRARLEDHIGAFTVEPLRSRAGLMADRQGLAALNAVCALLRVSLAEREAHGDLWRDTASLLDRLSEPGWQPDYLFWELRLLEELGFGLDLASCAVTGATSGLAYVSPKTGRAVSRAAAGEWVDRLFPLPPVLGGDGNSGLAEGLAITGHFLLRELAPVLGNKPLPEARARLVGMIGQ
jgi:DNA repair protein RecO (recombination protein O)